jgi:glutamate/tyrosine decarboxylase-like PLP-dependent enzyme
MYFSENGLNPTAFPSLRKFETEVVAMTASLLGGGPRTVGNMTTGGTESIMMAVKTARDWGVKERGVRGTPEMVLPVSAHPAFEKAAHYFGLKPIHIPVDRGYRADVAAARRAITRRTVLLVGSAPSYPQGVVDPIVELAALARERGVLCHVDACVGGMMLPFVRQLGYEVPPFDFRIPGVTSLSVDLHKYGYAAKGASVILYRDPELRRLQYFAYTDWPGGIYVSPTMTGTRPGGAIAAAWAIMHRLGREGYRAIAQEVMEATRQIQAGVATIDGITVLGKPQMSVMALASSSKEIDIYEVGDLMSQRGWHMDRQQFPASLHLTVNRGHLPSVDRFLGDLRRAAAGARKEPLKRALDRSAITLASTAARVLPGRVVSKLTAAVGARMGIGDGAQLPQKSAAMYGMMAALPNRGDLHEVVIDILDRMTRPDAAAHRSASEV